MTGISSTPTTLRSATATARVGVTADGDAQQTARVAAMLAVKQAAMWMPQLQPIPSHDVEIDFAVADGATLITVTVRAVAAMTLGPYSLAGVTAAAICLHDVIERVELVSTTGDATQFPTSLDDATAVVIVLSDTVASGKKPDTAGKSVVAGLERAGFDVLGYEVLPDDRDQLAGRLAEWLERHPDLILTVGGTGLGERDSAVDVVQPLITTEIPGLMEASRAFGQARTPYAMLSRGVAGLVGETVVATLPGSRKGAEETMDAIATGLVHLIEVGRKTRPHHDGYT